MRLGEALGCTAVGALSLRRRNIHREDSAQFSRGSVTVNVVEVI
jgi:hypothetical protein